MVHLGRLQVCSRSGIGCRIGPPGYRFLHNLPNKPLTGNLICKILKAKEMFCKIFKTMELWLLRERGDTSLRLVDSVSTQVQLYMRCQARRPAFLSYAMKTTWFA